MDCKLEKNKYISKNCRLKQVEIYRALQYQLEHYEKCSKCPLSIYNNKKRFD